ncbi:protein associated with RNAse G/E [Alkalihalobacillus xiaoxiensis]|uniref:Protein associated with RNAse G/E n=1 Tax=Shouchella xiaoxiensis TaxID=766895 RepID=A0ABS2SUQ0_9BACI|nr:DUF402 domain-containing protein [Shouchella xiaoxiensis]MBM7839260.1 protein associated with RNAse G/E [Shouchella xiaoxiensis]
MEKIIERKHTYWGDIVDHSCKLLRQTTDFTVLFHEIKDSFEIKTNGATFYVPIGTYTTAYYWKNRFYNVYIWRNQTGQYLGSYVNFVSRTTFTTHTVEFCDLIIDLLILPDLSYSILDMEELPLPLNQIENGVVKKEMDAFIQLLDLFMTDLLREVNNDFPHTMMKEYLSS